MAPNKEIDEFNSQVFSLDPHALMPERYEERDLIHSCEWIHACAEQDYL